MARRIVWYDVSFGRAASRGGFANSYNNSMVTRAVRGLDGPWRTTGLDIKYICSALYFLRLVSFGAFPRSMVANGVYFG